MTVRCSRRSTSMSRNWLVSGTSNGLAISAAERGSDPPARLPAHRRHVICEDPSRSAAAKTLDGWGRTRAIAPQNVPRSAAQPTVGAPARESLTPTHGSTPTPHRAASSQSRRPSASTAAPASAAVFPRGSSRRHGTPAAPGARQLSQTSLLEPPKAAGGSSRTADGRG